MRYALAASSCMNDGTWPLLNSAGRCSASWDQTGLRCEPRSERRSAWYASCRVSEVGACHQTIRSASARSPATSYQPRITKSSFLVARSMARIAASALSIGGSSSPTFPLEHRPHRVTDGVVDLPRLHLPPPYRLIEFALDHVTRSDRDHR